MLSRKRAFSRPAYWLLALFFLIALLLLVSNLAVISAAEKSTYGVRLSPESWAATSGIEPIQTIDYGDFVWLELEQEDFATLQADNIAYEQLVDGYALRLGEQSFDGKYNPPCPTCRLGQYKQ